MATVESERTEILCRLSEAVQTNEDSSSFKNSFMGLHRFTSPESNGTVRFLRRVRPNEVEVLVVLRVVFLDASQIIKGTQCFPFTTSQMVKAKSR